MNNNTTAELMVEVERLRGELHKLKLIAGISDTNKFETAMDRLRVERDRFKAAYESLMRDYVDRTPHRMD